jgi:gluconolactonase
VICAKLHQDYYFPKGRLPWMTARSFWLRLRAGTLSRVTPDGKIEVIAETGGGPNGAAIGPDGAVYICNNGGFEWHDVNGLYIAGRYCR